jgi:hypothetical protein
MRSNPCRGRHLHLAAPVPFLLLLLSTVAARGSEIRGAEIVEGDPAAETILRRLTDLDPEATIEVLGRRSETNPVTGYEYTFLKARLGSKDVTGVLNETTGAFTTDRDQPGREARALLESLPPSYRKMGLGLLARVREAEGGRLGSGVVRDVALEVTFYARSAESLDAIEAALGTAPFLRYDVPALLEQSPAVVRPSKTGSTAQPGPAPPVRAVLTMLPLREVLRVTALEAVAHVEITGRVTPDLDQGVARVRGNVV